jgi:prephenate dehydratase
MRLLTLGPAGTFSHEAAEAFHPDAEIVFAPNFDAVFQQLQRGGGVGFVPIENSLHGPVDEILDLLHRSDVKIWKTEDVAVRHCFGALDPSQVRKVASHPQALGQCRLFLRERFPEAEHIPTSSTSAAVEMALQDPTVGAIASERAMLQRGLPVLQHDVQKSGNTTRFAIIAQEDPFPSRPKSQMCVTIHGYEDRPGMLHDLLSPFKEHGVNLSRIESRPTGEKLGDYIFFVEFAGTRDMPHVRRVLEQVGTMASVRILGEW